LIIAIANNDLKVDQHVATGTQPYDVLIAGYGPTGMLAGLRRQLDL